MLFEGHKLAVKIRIGRMFRDLDSFKKCLRTNLCDEFNNQTDCNRLQPCQSGFLRLHSRCQKSLLPQCEYMTHTVKTVMNRELPFKNLI